MSAVTFASPFRHPYIFLQCFAPSSTFKHFGFVLSIVMVIKALGGLASIDYLNENDSNLLAYKNNV